ncbi:MAG TPA: hypothetical protein VIW26_12060 [Gemmatimonadales bacterium]|jgi:hypothetical protein
MNRFRDVLASENRHGGRVSTICCANGTLAATGDWNVAVALCRTVINELRQEGE